MGVAQVRDFYKLKEMSEHDLSIVYGIINNSNKNLRETHIEFIDFFQEVFELKKQSEKLNINDKEINETIDIAIHNLEEELHGLIENDSIPYINSILEENIDFFNSTEDRSNFSYFLMVQFVRTQKYKKLLAEVFKNEEFKIDNIWSVISHIFALNLGHSLANDKKIKMVLLVNNNIDEFITADQPVFNTYEQNKDEPPKKHEFYYPVSPKLAILLTDKLKKYTSKKYQVSNDEVIKYNKMIARNSLEQLYATSEEILRKYQ